MLPKLRLVKLDNMHIFRQLQIEELLFRSSNSNWCLVNTGPTVPTIVTGFSGKVPELVHIEEAKRDNIEVIRRFTGGGTVIVDKNTLFVTFIMDSQDLNISPYPRDIMKWSDTAVYKHVFRDAKSEFTLRENDYVMEDLKIGGNAQAIAKTRFVHHTSFLWDFSSRALSYLQIPQKMPGYRQKRSHTEFLTKLKHHYKTLDQLVDSFEDHILSSFDVEVTSQNDLSVEVEALLGDRNLTDISRTKF